MIGSLLTANRGESAEVKLGDAAPLFQVKTHEGKPFELASRKGQWTVLFFYPKAGTPGCTKQACAFRDSVDKIRAQGAEVFGISADSVKDQAAFHAEHKLKYTLLADEDYRAINSYGSKYPVVKMSKRWTFIIDPELKIRSVRKDVDPVLDAKNVSEELARLQQKK